MVRAMQSSLEDPIFINENFRSRVLRGGGEGLKDIRKGNCKFEKKKSCRLRGPIKNLHFHIVATLQKIKEQRKCSKSFVS